MILTKKILSANLLLVLLMLCGCTTPQENTDTRFLLDTFVTLTARCDEETLEEAFALCKEYERLLSRTEKDSDVSRINRADGAVEVSPDTAKLLRRALYYGELSGGAFDVTVCPVSSLWDFNNEVIPSKDEIAAALRNVDYGSVETHGNTVDPHGKQIDLGGIAKGFIADRLIDFFRTKGVPSGTVNLGGNLFVFGKKESTVGIRKPFTEDGIAARVRVRGKSAVTSGTYERYIERDGKRYHHILDPKTGYGVESDLDSATVIGDCSLDCDALSTVCILLGRERAAALIEQTPRTEAVFIAADGSVTHTSGLTEQKGILIFKSDTDKKE